MFQIEFKMKSQKIKFIIFLISFPIIWTISVLPDFLFYRLSDLLYFLMYRIFGYRKKMVRQNLRWAFPEKSEKERKTIERKFYKHFCDILLETTKTITISKKEISKKMQFPNIEVLEQFTQKQQSFIIMCGHYNSYEWLLSVAQHINIPSYAVYTPITNPYFDRMIKKARSRFNAFLISRYEINSLIIQNKNKTIAYGFASDQSPSNTPKQYRRNFLGIKVPVFTGAERIAKQFDFPVIFCDIQKEKRGHYKAYFQVITEKPTELPNYQITDIFTELLENQIQKAPEFYFWTHNRFKYRDTLTH